MKPAAAEGRERSSSSDVARGRLADVAFAGLLAGIQRRHAAVVEELKAAKLEIRNIRSGGLQPGSSPCHSPSNLEESSEYSADESFLDCKDGLPPQSREEDPGRALRASADSEERTWLPSVELGAGGQLERHEQVQFNKMGGSMNLWPEWRDLVDSTEDTEPSPLHLRAWRRSTMAAVRMSGDMIQEESLTLRHLVMRPNGANRLLWDTLSMLVLLFDVISFPLFLCFDVETLQIMVVDWLIAIFWTIDIFVTFLTGFHNSGVVEMRLSKIAMRYARFWLCIDMTIVIMDWVVVAIFLHTLAFAGLLRVAKTGRTLRILKVLKLVRLLRVGKVNALLSSVFVRIRSEVLRTVVHISLLVVVILLVNHYTGCFWWYLGSIGPAGDNWVQDNDMGSSTLYHYTTALHWSLTQFTPAGMEIYPKNTQERVYSIMVLLFALITFSSFVSSITAAMSHLRELQTEPEKQEALLRSYFSDNHISAELNQRILDYCHHVLWSRKQKLHQTDMRILNTLPDGLTTALRTEIFTPTLVVAPFFKFYRWQCGAAFSKLCFKAMDEIFLFVGGELFSEGKHAEYMYFCSSGSMLYTLGRHMTPGPSVSVSEKMGAPPTQVFLTGQCACEQVLWMPWTHVGTATATSPCDLVTLNAKVFREVAASDLASRAYIVKYAAGYWKLMFEEHSGMTNWGCDLELHSTALGAIASVAAGLRPPERSTASWTNSMGYGMFSRESNVST